MSKDWKEACERIVANGTCLRCALACGSWPHPLEANVVYCPGPGREVLEGEGDYGDHRTDGILACEHPKESAQAYLDYFHKEVLDRANGSEEPSL